MFQSELLSPAGNLKNLSYALAYGADAVYAGQPRYSLRVRNNDFKSLENLGKGIQQTQNLGKKFYLATNIAPHNSKIHTFMKDMEPIIELGPDALIMSDPGLIMMIKDRWPDQAIHLSVQANVVNFASVEFWRRQGVERIILSRELSLEEIEAIRNECPQMELEVFVHGALCIAYSGRCLLSGYINHRDPNQGTCTNSCRWKYSATEAVETMEGGVVAVHNPAPQDNVDPQLGVGETTDKIFLLEEENRPGEQMAAYEDEHGTYIMNSKDLRAVQHVGRFCEMGVHSLKIEGRTKSHYYVARTTQIYREAIDDAVAGKPFDMNKMDQLESLANRGYTEGFYRRHVHDEFQNYENGTSVSDKQQFVGEIIDRSDDDCMVVDVKNKFQVGDTLELMTPKGNHTFHLDGMTNKNGKAVEVAPGSGHIVKIKLPDGADTDKALLIRNL